METKKANERIGIYKYKGQNIKSFAEIEDQKNMIEIDVSDNKLTDFIGLEDNEKLTTLNLNNNPILTFRGFPSLPNLTSVSFFGTPISKLSNFRQLVIMACGQQIQYINGKEVSKIDLSTSYQYGDPTNVCKLMARGWLPKKTSYTLDLKVKNLPSEEDVKRRKRREQERKKTNNKNNKKNINKNKSKNNSNNKANKTEQGINKKTEKNIRSTQLTRILEQLDKQEKDPISVRAVRILRTIGYKQEDIQVFLREYFSEGEKGSQSQSRTQNSERNKGRCKGKDTDRRNEIEEQMKKNEELIKALASQLHSLRNENRTYNTYESMIRSSGAALFENAKIINEYEEAKEANEQENDDGDGNGNGNENGKGKKAKKAKKEAGDNYEGLRDALIDFLEADPTFDDIILIRLLLEGKRAEEYFYEEEGEEEEEIEEDGEDEEDRDEDIVICSPEYYQSLSMVQAKEGSDIGSGLDSDSDEFENEFGDEFENEDGSEIEGGRKGEIETSDRYEEEEEQISLKDIEMIGREKKQNDENTEIGIDDDSERDEGREEEPERESKGKTEEGNKELSKELNKELSKEEESEIEVFVDDLECSDSFNESGEIEEEDTEADIDIDFDNGGEDEVEGENEEDKEEEESDDIAFAVVLKKKGE